MLTYIEPCGWCSSSISSTICPSNVDKSNEPCPNLSSSLASSSSLLSNTDSISLSTDSTSEGKRRRTSTCLIRSSLNHPNDYHTSKRIDELHERMDDIQISSFLKFINYHLSLNKTHENLHIDDFVKDLSNGHILIDLIEILSSRKFKREHGQTRFHSITNVQYVLDYLKLRMQHINISPHEIVSGNRKQILALLWMIMKIFDFPAFRLTNKNCFVENTLLGFGQDRSILLKWLNQIINQSLNTAQIYIRDFSLQTWMNGYYFSIILQYLIPLSIKYFTTKSFDYLKELNIAKKECFQICLNLSNYCFNTITMVDYTDQSDKCLFKYLTELQQNVLSILKTNYIEKLIQNNSYAKQIFDTVSQTTEHSSHIINDNEQYLVCIDEEKDGGMTLNSMGHLTVVVDESSNLRMVEEMRVLDDEQERMKVKRKNQWQTTESNSHMTNGHHETSKEEQMEEIIDSVPPPQEQHNGSVEKSDQSIVTNQDLEQLALTVAYKYTEQMTVINVESSSNGRLEQPITEAPKPQELVRSNAENNCEKPEKIEQAIENKNFTMTDEKLPHLATIIEEPQQKVIKSNEEDKQVITECETSEQTPALAEEIEQKTVATEEQKQSLMSKDKVEQYEIENEPTINIKEKLAQPIVEMEEAPQPITSLEENNKSTIEHEKLEQPIVEELAQALASSEETEQNVARVTENETFATSNGQLKSPTIERIEAKPMTVEHEKLDQTSSPIETVEQFIEHKPLESASCVIPNKKTEQTPVTIVKEKFEQSTIKESPPVRISNEKTTAAPTENKSSIITNKKLEKPVVIESQQPIPLNRQINKSTTTNKKSTATTKKPTLSALPIQQNQYLITPNEQRIEPTIVVKEPEQRKFATDLPPQTTTTTTTPRCLKYSDIVNKQLPKINNESVQTTTTSFKKQEQSTVPKKKTIPIEKPKQVLLTAVEIEQIPSTSTIKESVQSEVSLEKQDQFTTVIEETAATGILHEETKKSPTTKNKKSRRSHAKKRKAKNPTIKPETPPQSVINNEEEIESSLPSLTLTTTIQEQEPTNIQNSSTTPKTSSNDHTSINHENSQISTAPRSRKNRKKKTIATTTTTLIENTSSPVIPTPTTLPTRNLFLITNQSIHDGKLLAFKCIFILLCLCFSILILVLSHK